MCGIVRKYHFDIPHRWKKMSDAEWLEFCTDPVEDRILRTVTEVTDGRILLECGHSKETALAHAIAVGVLIECEQCKENKTMGWINGHGKAVASPAPEEEIRRGAGNTPQAESDKQTALIVPHNNVSIAPAGGGGGNNGELARWMPIMDIEQAIQRRDVIVQAMQRLMKEGVDYGTVGDGKKPGLFQPGADKLCSLFGLTLKYKFLEKEEDWSGEQHGGEPFFYYQVGVDVFRAEFHIGEGVGSCSSRESKYRWRKRERLCPACQKPSVRKSKDDGGGYYCWSRIGGCGAKFQDGDQSIEGQQLGRVPNGDIEDQVNTILKMAYKRAKVSGTINATSASEFFTQDVEDFTPPQEEPIDIGGRQPNSRAAQQFVAEQKIATGNLNPAGLIKWTGAQMAEAFQAMRKELGETAYLGELERYGWQRFQDIKNAIDNRTPGARQNADNCYRQMQIMARKEGK